MKERKKRKKEERKIERKEWRKKERGRFKFFGDEKRINSGRMSSFIALAYFFGHGHPSIFWKSNFSGLYKKLDHSFRH